MRDTIIGILLFAAVITGVSYFRSTSSSLPQNPEAEEVAASTSQSTENSFSSKKRSIKPAHKGVRHEVRRYGKSRQAKIARSSERTRSEAYEPDLESQSLPSIYSSQEAESVGFEPESESVRGNEKVAKSAPKTLHGVPVRDWILSRRNSLASEPADPRAAEGMRVFLQCVEVKKKGAQFVG